MKLFMYGLGLLLLALGCNQPPKLPVIDHIALANSTLKVEVLAKNLDVPWDIDYADNGFLWVAEHGGTVSRIDLQTGVRKQMLAIKEVWRKRTAGLLGMVVHPDFKNNPYVFVNYTLQRDSLVFNHLVRYEFKNDTLTNAKLLLEVNGFTAHNGSRLAISADGKLLWATGDAYKGENAQDLKSLNGKILRLNTDGSIPSDNPYPNSYVWARGFRNMQGLTIGKNGQMYTSEHGDAIEDEVNLIEKGANYGWPSIEGEHNLPNEITFAGAQKTTLPLRSWTPVIAPAGISYYGNGAITEWQNSLLLTTLKTKTLRVLKLSEDGKEITSEELFFKEHYGRLRDVCVGSNGEIYISTSNQDWNPSPGFPLPEDDKILKITLSEDKAPTTALKGINASANAALKGGRLLYQQYCASCHKEDGKGIKGAFPALSGSAIVQGAPEKLSALVLNGTQKQMPAFKFLTDDDAAQILTYIRTQWGNKAGEVSPSIVKKQRK